MTDKNAAHRDMANAIRALALDAVQQADSGHPGLPMGMADPATVLFCRFLKFGPAAPLARSDRFVSPLADCASGLYEHFAITAEAIAEQARRLTK